MSAVPIRSAAPAAAGSRPDGRARKLQQLRVALPFMLPGLVLIALFVIFPLVRGIQMSLYHWNLMAPSQSTFVGSDNYVRALTKDPLFWPAARNTLLYAAVTVPAQMALGLGAALLLNVAVRGRGFFRALYYLPVVTSWLIVSYVFAYLFTDGLGPVNYFLVNVVHVIDKPIDWLHDAWGTAEVPINLLGIWNMVIFLAALQSIPHDIIEAANTDGAGTWQRFRFITLPLLRPTVLFVSIVLVGGAFNVFLSVILMTGGGPQGSTEVLLSYMYNQAFKNLDFGYGTAIGLLMGVAVVAVGFLLRRLSRGTVEY
jgi:multiple sugar transport system permease protein